MENVNSNIKTIILCGGMGTRLKEETEFKPKPLVNIGSKPILWHIMKIYSHFGYNDFILALGFKGEMIKNYFLDKNYQQADFTINTEQGSFSNIYYNNKFGKDNFNITFSDTGLKTPHGERVLKLKKYINEDIFMVTYGDGIANIDINKLVEFHKSKGKIATITGIHPTSKWGLIKTDKQGFLTQFDQKPYLYDYANGGFMVFNKEFFDFIKPGDMIEDSFKRLIPIKQISLYKHEDFWYGMDTYRDFMFLNKLWEENPKWKIWKS